MPPYSTRNIQELYIIVVNNAGAKIGEQGNSMTKERKEGKQEDVEGLPFSCLLCTANQLSSTF